MFIKTTLPYDMIKEKNSSKKWFKKLWRVKLFHNSQNLSVSSYLIDIGYKTFIYGQSYVALLIVKIDGFKYV